MANRITSVVEIAVKDAIKNLQDTQKELGKTELSGKDLAEALEKAANNAEAELKSVAAASAAMERALGADFVAARAAAGTSVDDIVGELNRLGVSFQAIESDADSLAASVKRLDSVRNPIRNVGTEADTVARKVDGVTSSADQSRAVLGSMVGGSVSDLSALGGVAGTTGQVLDQMASYAVEGQLGLKGLVAAGPALVGLSALLLGMSQNAKENAEQIRAAAEATKELATAADTAVMYTFGEAISNAIMSGENLGEVLERMAQDNLPGLKRALDLGTQSGELNAEMQRLMADAIAEAERAAAQAEETQRKYGDALIDAAAAATAAADAGAAAGVTQAQQIARVEQALRDYMDTVGGIPVEKYTEIRAAIARGDFAAAEALINEITRPRIVQVGMALNQGALGGAMAGAGRSVGSAVGAGIAAAIAGASLPSSVTGGGGGGGGGGGSSPADAEVDGWAVAIARAYEYGEITRDEYRKYLSDRLAGEQKYGDAYDKTWKQIQALDREAAAERKKADDERIASEKEAAAEAKKRADEERRLALEIAAYADAVQRGIAEAAGRISFVAVNNTSADPAAVVNILRKYVKTNGRIQGIS